MARTVPSGRARRPPPETPFALGATACRGGVVIAASGECDLATVPLLEDALATAIAGGAGRVVVDLRRATLVDASTTRALLDARQRLRLRRRTLTVLADLRRHPILRLPAVRAALPVVSSPSTVRSARRNACSPA